MLRRPSSSPTAFLLHPCRLPPPCLHLRSPPTRKETNILDKRKDEATGRTVVNQYVILEELGRGQHGKVRLAQDQTDGSYWVRRSPLFWYA